MEALFLQILSMSVSASWLIVAVILIRFLLKKAPKGFRYVLWALVGIRLLCPVFIESDFSLVPSQDIIADAGEAIKPILPIQPIVPEGNDAVTNDTVPNDNGQNNIVQNQQSQNTTGSNDTTQNNTTQNNASNNTTMESPATFTLETVMPWIWLGGILVLIVYAIVSYVQLRNTLKTAIQREDNLWICDGIQSPFILGLIRPQIYLPSYIADEHIPYIVAHEKEHIRCKDNWWKPLGFVLLTVHWFNPLVWVAYILMCKDIELACDERVIRTMGVEDKKNYSKSLLLCSNPRHFISACPVAFGEVGVKERIKKIVDYRKPSVWIIGIGIVVCIIVAIGFMTNPKEEITGVSKITLRGGNHYEVDVEITDEETITYITDMVNNMTFIPTGLTAGTGGWSYWLQWHDADGNEIESFLILGDNKISKDPFFYRSINRAFDTDFFDELIENEYKMLEQIEPESEMDELSKDKLEWFATKFFNNEEKRITNMFLTSEYRNAEDISLENLFYHGANGYGNTPVSEEEKQMLAQIDSYTQEHVYSLDISKVTRQEMETVLQRYMDMSFWETNQIDLRNLYYLPEYEAYYKIAGDAMGSKYVFEKGWVDEAGSIILEYYDELNGDNTQLYRVTLKEVNGNYRFVSNVSMAEDSNTDSTKEWPEHLLTQENLKWFETEFFNLEDNRITNQFLTSEYQVPEDIDLYELFYIGNGVVGIDNNASQEERRLLLERYIEKIHNDVTRVSSDEMNQILQKYMGLSIEQTTKLGIDYMYYLTEYDAYYIHHGDTNYERYEFEKGFFNGDGTITLLYKSFSDYINVPKYIVTLKPVGDSYQFISNMKIGNDN
ncbi:MAG: M56 family metallopeptidase [Agathobacter sp.]|nr:M56 family metallopeptidase [Agathobacter sp.]